MILMPNFRRRDGSFRTEWISTSLLAARARCASFPCVMALVMPTIYNLSNVRPLMAHRAARVKKDRA